MKKVIMTIFIIISILFTSTQIVYADETWVDKAFSATKDFMKEPISETDTLKTSEGKGIITEVLSTFKDIIKSINTILLVVLAWLSAISITITGARYILSGSSPNQKAIAGRNLKTAFKGMAFGFGAFIIWRVAMGLVLLVIG